MAKLNGVKTLDMQNGEITRIEYEGVVYAKVDELHDAKKGDILHPIERSMDVSKDAFYKVIGTRSSYIRFIDDVSENGFDFDYPLVKLFRKVDADLKCGDRVKAIRSGEFRDIARGEYGVIIDTEFYKGDPYNIEVSADDGDVDFFRPQDLELATPAEIKKYESSLVQKAKDAVFAKAGRKPNEYRKGDLGRITDTHGASGYNVGDIVEVDRDFEGESVVDAVHLNDGYIVEIEIVCFVENRVDRKDAA